MSVPKSSVSEESSLDAPAEEGLRGEQLRPAIPPLVLPLRSRRDSPTSKRKSSKKSHRRQLSADDPDLATEPFFETPLASTPVAMETGSPSPSSQSPMDPLRVTLSLGRHMNPASGASSEAVDTPTATPTHSDQGEVPPLKITLPMSIERTVSEDSILSDSSASNDKSCSFCNRGERSLLGQGDLTLYDPTPGFNPFKQPLKRRNSLDTDEKVGDRSPKHLTWRRNRGPPKNAKDRSKSPRRSGSSASAGPACTVDELNLVGLQDDVDANQVFEKSGHVRAHHCCAAWSEGVIQADDCSLQFVDKAVVNGLSQKCSFCKRYGATIHCRFPKCAARYHYPCASGGGCFQDIKTLSLLCPEHIDQAESIAGSEALCIVCDLPGCIGDQLFCTSCGQHYHGNCLDPPVQVNPVVRSGWQCPECKICQTCRQPGDDNKMLVCDTCDKGYHIFCLRPTMTTIPKNGWKCKNCRVCGDCGARTPGSGPSSRWHLNYSVCDSCYQQRHKGLCCPLCRKAYRHFTQKEMAQCNICKKYVHGECDSSLDMQQRSALVDYTCPVCKNRDTNERIDFIGLTDSLSQQTSVDSDYNLQDIEGFSIFKGLRDPPSSSATPVRQSDPDFPESSLMTEDSVSSSMDIDLSVEKMHQFVNIGASAGASNSSQPPSRSSSPKPVGHGLGKPYVGKKLGKKLNPPQQNRPKVATVQQTRPVSIGKKNKPRSEPRNRGRKAKSQKSSLGVYSSDQASKDDDSNAMAVICSKNDHFTLMQDLCVSCGSLGSNEEGRLIVCSQCGQCYHPYCANVKLSKIILEKGWRCLDCTVCEGCGRPHDESRLILCDECDISYHIYCLEPPLDAVPRGTWKCKWCAVCITCGTRSAGTNCSWQNNYSQCGPCYSTVLCPLCYRTYKEEDLIIQCNHCDRWLHANCDGIRNEDDAERAAEFGYNCSLCRPLTGAIGPLPPLPSPEPPSPVAVVPELPPPPPPIMMMPKPPEPYRPPKTYYMDGVILYEHGLTQIKSQLSKMIEKRKPQRRVRRGSFHQGDVANRDAPINQPLSRFMEDSKDDTDDLKPAGNTSELLDIYDTSKAPSSMLPSPDANETPLLGDDIQFSPLEKGPLGDGGLGGISPTLSQLSQPPTPSIQGPGPGGPGLGLEKKRKRIRIGTGVGGFMASRRSRGFGGGRGSRGGMMGPPSRMNSMDDDEPRFESDGRRARGRRRQVRPRARKSQLSESYPEYLQEAFFGKELVDSSRKEDDRSFDFASSDDNLDEKLTPLKDDPYTFPSSPPKGKTIAQLKGTQRPSLDSLSLDHDNADDSDKDNNIELNELNEILPPELLGSEESELMGIFTTEDMDQAEEDADEANDKSSTGAPLMLNPTTLDPTGLLDKNLDTDLIPNELTQIDSKTLDDIFKDDLDSGGPPSHPKMGDGFKLPPLPSPSIRPDQVMIQQQQQHRPQMQQNPMTPHPQMQGQVPGPPGPPGQPPRPMHHQHQPGQMMQMPPDQLRMSMAAQAMKDGNPMFGLSQHDATTAERFSLQFAQAMHGTQPQEEFVPEEGERISYNKRNIMKWEKDEEFGENATISPVLYANLAHPELRTQFPEWSERAKQIAKLWRKVPADQRAPYLAKARENRATNRQFRASKQGPKQVKKRKQDEVVPPLSIGGPPSVAPGPPLPPGPPGTLGASPVTSEHGLSRDGEISQASSQPGTPHAGTPVPGTPVPGTPVPGTPGPDDKSKGTPDSEKPPLPDPYAMPPQTPTPTTQSPTATRPAIRPLDPYSQPPGTPHPNASHSQGYPPPPRPMSSSPQDVFRAPRPPLPCYPQAQPTREMYPHMEQRFPRPFHPDPYAMQPRTPMPNQSQETLPYSQPQPPKFLPPQATQNHPSVTEGDDMEHRFPPPENIYRLQPVSYFTNNYWHYAKPMGMESAKAQELQKQQLRELLAQQTKQRQSKKKQDDDSPLPPVPQQGQPSQRWPEEGAGMQAPPQSPAPQMQFPQGFGSEGFGSIPGMPGPRGPGPGPVPPGGFSGPPPSRGPRPNMDQWPENQLMHHSPMQPAELEQFNQGHMPEIGPGGVGGAPGPVRIIRPGPGHPGPGFPRGPPGYPQGYPGGHSQYMDMRHPSEPLSAAERHRIPYLQMFQERLRQQQNPREGAPNVPGASPPAGLKLRMPQVGMGPRPPRPMKSPGPGTPDQQFNDPMLRASMMQQQQLRANMQQQHRPPMMMQQQMMPPRHMMRPAAPPHPSHAKGPDDDQLEDLLRADGSFNLLEYADADDLDQTLTEEHDKSMFDEHLGIKLPGDEDTQESTEDKKEEAKTGKKENSPEASASSSKPASAVTTAASAAPVAPPPPVMEPKKEESPKEEPMDTSEEPKPRETPVEPKPEIKDEKIPQVDGAFDSEEDEDREVRMLMIPQVDGPSDEPPAAPAPAAEDPAAQPPPQPQPLAPMQQPPQPHPTQEQPAVSAPVDVNQFQQQQQQLMHQQMMQQQHMRHPMQLQQQQQQQQQRMQMIRGTQQMHFHQQMHPQMMQRTPVTQGLRSPQPQAQQGQPVPSSHPMIRTMAPPPPYPGRGIAVGPNGQPMPQRAQMMEQHYRMRHQMYMQRQQIPQEQYQVRQQQQQPQQRPIMMQQQRHNVPPNHLPLQGMPQTSMMQPHRAISPHAAQHMTQSPRALTPGGSMPGHSPVLSPHPGQSPHHPGLSPHHQSPASAPSQSPITGQSPRHHSPHTGQSQMIGHSPHQSPQMTGGKQPPLPGSSPHPGMSPLPVPSPHPKASPLPLQNVYHSQSSPRSGPSPHPHPGSSPHPGASPHHSSNIQSPLPHSRSTTPLVQSPWGSQGPASIGGSQPSTPHAVLPPGSAGSTPTASAPLTPGSAVDAAPASVPPKTPPVSAPTAPPSAESASADLAPISTAGTPPTAAVPIPQMAQLPMKIPVPAGAQPLSAPVGMPAQPQTSHPMPTALMPTSTGVAHQVSAASASAGMPVGVPPMSVAPTSAGMPSGIPPMSAAPTSAGMPAGVPPMSAAPTSAGMPAGVPPMSAAMPTMTMVQISAAPGMSLAVTGTNAGPIPQGMTPMSAPGMPQVSGPLPMSSGVNVSAGMTAPPAGMMAVSAAPSQDGQNQNPAMVQMASQSMPMSMPGPPHMVMQRVPVQGMPGNRFPPGHRMMDPNMAHMRPGPPPAGMQPMQYQQHQQRMAMFQQMPPEMRLRMQHQQFPPGMRQVYQGQGQAQIQGQPPQRMMSPPHQRPRLQPPMQQPRPRLLDEQPLLLEDLLEQEKLEQRRQAEQQVMLQQPPATTQQQPTTSGTTAEPAAPSAPGILSDSDLEKLKVDVLPDGTPRPQVPIPPGAVPTPQPPQALQSPHQMPQGPRLQHMPDPALGQPPQMPAFPAPRGPTTPQMSPRTPSPFLSPSPGMGPMYPRIPSPGMQSPPMVPPPKPPVPAFRELHPEEPLTDEEQRQQMQYEEWLMQQANFLGGQVRTLESQVTKLRRQKKSLVSKQKQAKKSGTDLTEPENQTLERTTGELSRLQKQLEGQRKQQKSHQGAIQDYRAKQQERFGPNWPGQTRPPLPSAPNPAVMPPVAPPTPGQPPQTLTSPPPPRMPGSANGNRLTSSARLEYDAYMQGRLRMMTPQSTAAVRATMVLSGQSDDEKKLKMSLQELLAQDENNPFSESYQQRQQIENAHQQEQQRLQMQQHMEQQQHRMQIEGPEMPGEPMAPPATYDGSPRARFPSPRFPGDPALQRPPMAPRMPRPSVPMPMPGQMMSPTGEVPPSPGPGPAGFQMGQHPRFPGAAQMPPGPGLSSPSQEMDPNHDKIIQSTPPTPSDLVTPAPDALTMTPGEKPKKKRKRRKKKEMDVFPGPLPEMDPMLMLQQQQMAGLAGAHPGIPQSPISGAPMIGPDGRPMFPPGMPLQRPPMPEVPPGSGMSELQKLVNMQPPPGMEDKRHDVFPPHPATPGAISPRGQIPSTQPVPPHMGGFPTQDDASVDDEGAVGESLLDFDGDLSQNLLLKKLLANPRGKDGRLQVDEEERVKLTPEQQRQLALIESMPLTMETEISQEQWELKTPEEKERIIELRRQEFERRRKELAESQSKKGQPRQRKKRKDSVDPLGPAKKRPKKGFPVVGPPSPKMIEDIDYNAIHELIMQQLGSLPRLSLQEPEVPASRSVCPLTAITAPTSPVPDTELKGVYGDSKHETTQGIYQDFPFAQPKSPSSPVKSEDKEDKDSKQQQSTEHKPGEDRQLFQTGISRAPFAGVGIDPRPASVGAHDKVPSPPLIEPRPHLMSRGSDQSPATIVSSSSPECMDIKPMNPLLPIGLRLISEDSRDSEELPDRQSPEIDLIKPVPIKVQPKEEKENPDIKPKVEVPPPGSVAHLEPLRDIGNQMTVTLTMSSRAAEDIGGVLNAIADLLKIAVPPSFEVSRSPSPDLFSFAKHAASQHIEEKVDLQTLIKSRMKFCRHCDVACMTGVKKKKSDIPFLGREEFEVNRDDEMMFCSEDCYDQFATAHRHARESQLARDELNAQIEAQRLKQMQLFAAQTQSPEPVPMPEKVRLRRTSSASAEPKPTYPPITERKWAGVKYKKWDPSIMKVGQVAPPPSEKVLSDSLVKLGQTIKCPQAFNDTRACVLCHVTGDIDTDGPGRLLHLCADKWVHLNCALWSYEVYETMNGSLVNVDQACKRGAGIQCVVCSQDGATVGCFKLRCANVYHVKCAQSEGVIFFQDKTILCPAHTPKIPDNVLQSLAVFRRVFVSREEDKHIASFVHQEEKNSVIRVGSLIVHNIGQLLPNQLHSGLFNTRDYIYPVGFHSCRFYWSGDSLNKRCRYICKIDETENKPEFTVTVKSEGEEDVTYRGPTCSGVWHVVLDRLSTMRRENDLVKMFPSYLSGEDLFGLTDSNVLRMLESLPGIELISNYTFRYGRSPLFELPLAINPSGSARSEPKSKTPFKRPHTLHSSSNSRSIPATVSLVPGDGTMPYMKQFVHSKSQQYRRLKTEWRNNVYLRRSNVQGLGLFASRDLERHTMVIEYIGELIRSEVAEARERVYDSQNRGVYMFRIDDNTVVDATMTGGPARYVNHSCAPNCVAETVPFEKDSKIIIIARRRIARGEELTYDYKFDFEDDQHKIPCLCGAPNCRKWMN